MKVMALHGPRVAMLPDSAVTLPGRPVVLPDATSQWRGALCPALRIERLGKCIDERFGARYVDGMSLVLVILPGDGEASKRLWDNTSGGFDSAVTAGEWLPYRPGEITARANDCEFTFSAPDPGSAVSTASRHITIKTGDMILYPPALTIEQLPRERLRVTVDGTAVIDKRVI